MTDQPDQSTEALPPSESLGTALTRCQIELPPDQVATIEKYAQLLWEWNEKMNLTRHTSWDRFVERDVIDAMMLSQLVREEESILDVGSGGGLPGILLAILHPRLDVHLLDSVEKKTLAMRQMVKSLKLPIQVHRDRVQEHLAQHQYSTLVARAVAPMPKLLTWLKGHWPAFRRLLVIKGPAWKEECTQASEQNLTKRLVIRKAMSYPMMGTESRSYIIEVFPKGRKLDG